MYLVEYFAQKTSSRTYSNKYLAHADSSQMQPPEITYIVVSILCQFLSLLQVEIKLYMEMIILGEKFF